MSKSSLFSPRHFCWIGAALVASASAQNAAAQASVTLLCEGTGPLEGWPAERAAVTATFLVDFQASEVIYLDSALEPMWAAPATITEGSIVWLAVDFAQLPPNARTYPGTKQLRNYGRWPYGPPGKTIILEGFIDRATGRVRNPQFGGSINVPRFVNSGRSFQWTTMSDGVCRRLERRI